MFFVNYECIKKERQRQAAFHIQSYRTDSGFFIIKIAAINFGK